MEILLTCVTDFSPIVQEYGMPAGEGQGQGESQYSDINSLLDRILHSDTSIENAKKVSVDCGPPLSFSMSYC